MADKHLLLSTKHAEKSNAFSTESWKLTWNSPLSPWLNFLVSWFLFLWAENKPCKEAHFQRTCFCITSAAEYMRKGEDWMLFAAPITCPLGQFCLPHLPQSGLGVDRHLFINICLSFGVFWGRLLSSTGTSVLTEHWSSQHPFKCVIKKDKSIWMLWGGKQTYSWRRGKYCTGYLYQ